MSARRRSKKRSATSFEPPEPLTYFVDRDLGIRDVPAAVRASGARVELHRDHFPDDAPDVEWIPYAAERGWVILTQDRGIGRRPNERDLVLSTKAMYVCVAGGSRRGVETAAMIAGHFAIVDGLVRAQPRPLIARVNLAGVLLWDDKAKTWVQVRKKHLRRR